MIQYKIVGERESSKESQKGDTPEHHVKDVGFFALGQGHFGVKLYHKRRGPVKKMKIKIPERYREEYEALQEGQFKTRTALFIAVAAGIYYLVSFFYLFRYFLGNRDIFRLEEFYNWAVVFFGSSLFYWANRQSRSPEFSKICGYLFDFFLITMIGWLGFLYPSSALAFPFYFTLAFIVVAFTVPWSIRELYFLSVMHAAAFSGFCAGVVYGLHYPVPSLPRFHFYFDGLVLILVAAVLSIILRRQRIRRDIQNFLLLKEIEEKNAQIKKDLEFANRIHRTLIPESIRTKRADITVSYLPVSYVGGDYAKFHFWKDDALIFFICDVTGHGVAAALMVNRIHTEFERLAKEGSGPAELLGKLDEFIGADFTGTGLYLSAFCGALDFKTRRFLFSNYGHPPQFFHQAKKGTVEPLAAHTTLLGIPKAEDPEICQSEIPFESGDRVLLFTDGVSEAVSSTGEQFGGARIEKILREHSPQTGGNLNETLLQHLEKFSPALTDDVLLLTIHIH